MEAKIKTPGSPHDPIPGDAWTTDDRMKRGKVVLDLATRKVTAQ
jgi:hypothetical protein